MDDQTDFLDEIVAERVGQNAEFARLLDEALASRELLRGCAQAREAEHSSATHLRDH